MVQRDRDAAAKRVGATTAVPEAHFQTAMDKGSIIMHDHGRIHIQKVTSEKLSS